MLHASGITKSYDGPGGGLTILRSLSLEVAGGESVAIMGPSGSGKSTLLNILGALDPPTSGTFRVGEVDPYTLPPAELAAFRNRHIGFVFQEHYLLPQCTVLENVLLPSLAHARPSCADRAKALLKEVGLDERMEHRPGELSGGERQRAALARALINSPEVLLADEPTGNLDQHTAARIVALLKNIHAETQCALVVVTHSETIAAEFDRRADLQDGALRFSESAA